MLRMVIGKEEYKIDGQNKQKLKEWDYMLIAMLSAVQDSVTMPRCLQDKKSEADQDEFDMLLDNGSAEEADRPLKYHEGLKAMGNAMFEFTTPNYIFQYSHDGYHFSEKVMRTDGSLVYEVSPERLAIYKKKRKIVDYDLMDGKTWNEVIIWVQDSFNEQEFVPFFLLANLMKEKIERNTPIRELNGIKEDGKTWKILDDIKEFDKVAEEWLEIYKYSGTLDFDPNTMLPCEKNMINMLLGAKKHGDDIEDKLEMMGNLMGRCFIYTL